MIRNISALHSFSLQQRSVQPSLAAGELEDVSLSLKSEKNFNRSGELNEEQKAQVEKLKKADREIHAHEAAHKNAGGQHAGSASFTYTVGPDGKRYATGGEVPIDVAPIRDDPEATIAKLDVVIAAALAPAKPSAQDRKVAAAAVAARNQARHELLEAKHEEKQNSNSENVFDVNDFGEVSFSSVQKAYRNGIDLGVDGEKSSISIIS